MCEYGYKIDNWFLSSGLSDQSSSLYNITNNSLIPRYYCIKLSIHIPILSLQLSLNVILLLLTVVYNYRIGRKVSLCYYLCIEALLGIIINSLSLAQINVNNTIIPLLITITIIYLSIFSYCLILYSVQICNTIYNSIPTPLANLINSNNNSSNFIPIFLVPYSKILYYVSVYINLLVFLVAILLGSIVGYSVPIIKRSNFICYALFILLLNIGFIATTSITIIYCFWRSVYVQIKQVIDSSRIVVNIASSVNLQLFSVHMHYIRSQIFRILYGLLFGLFIFVIIGIFLIGSSQQYYIMHIIFVWILIFHCIILYYIIKHKFNKRVANTVVVDGNSESDYFTIQSPSVNDSEIQLINGGY